MNVDTELNGGVTTISSHILYYEASYHIVYENKKGVIKIGSTDNINM